MKIQSVDYPPHSSFLSVEKDMDIIIDAMLKDANGFLDRFRKGNNNKIEFVDIFDKDGNLKWFDDTKLIKKS